MRVAYLLDPPARLNARTDSSIELIRAHSLAGHEIFVVLKDGVSMTAGQVSISGAKAAVSDDDEDWLGLEQTETFPASYFDLIVIRLEPPVDASYRLVCQLLEHARRSGTQVLNHPLSILGQEEKLATMLYPELTPKSLVSSDRDRLLDFAASLDGGCMLKPLDGLGGKGVFAFDKGDSNLKVAIDSFLADNRTLVVQERLPGIVNGDRRVFMIAGAPCELMLNRTPAPGSHLGNMMAGGQPEAMELGEAEAAIGERIGPQLVADGIVFAGIDVIDGRLTEINITCPTGLRTVRDQTGVNVAQQVVAAMAGQITT